MQLLNNMVLNLIARWDSVFAHDESNDEKGQTMIEYGLILALISIVAIVSMGLVGDAIIAIFDDVVTALG